MKWLFDGADRYCAQSSWKDLALVKFCLCAIGVMIGVLLPADVKMTAFWVALIVFGVTYIPLMAKFFRILFVKSPETQSNKTEE